MKPDPNPLEQILGLARRAGPPPAPPVAAPTPEEITFLALRSFAAARRADRADDSLRAWERAGRWSLAGAAAALLLVAALRPTPEPANPFDPFTAKAAAPDSEPLFRL